MYCEAAKAVSPHHVTENGAYCAAHWYVDFCTYMPPDLLQQGLGSAEVHARLDQQITKERQIVL